MLANYTGVLIGATAIPVWFTHRRFLPAHFLTSGLGGSSAILELAGFLIPATQVLGLVTAGLETIFEFVFEIRKPAVDAPLHHGRSGIAFRIAGLLAGPVALAVRIIFGTAAGGRHAAAVCFLVGALISRYAWIWAGRAIRDAAGCAVRPTAQRRREALAYGCCACFLIRSAVHGGTIPLIRA